MPTPRGWWSVRAEHAAATARLVTDMNPAFFAALTLTVVDGAPRRHLEETGRFVLPDHRRCSGISLRPDHLRGL